MLGLRVTLNDEDPVTGGAEDMGVLSASISASGILGSKSVHPRPGEPPDLWLTLGGLTSRADEATDEHLRWLWSELKIGDRVTVELVAIEAADEPTERKLRKPKA